MPIRPRNSTDHDAWATTPSALPWLRAYNHYEVASILGVSPKTVIRWRNQGMHAPAGSYPPYARLPSGHICYPEPWLIAWLSHQLPPPDGAGRPPCWAKLAKDIARQQALGVGLHLPTPTPHRRNEALRKHPDGWHRVRAIYSSAG